MNSSHLKYATQIYAKAAVETADRRELEATLLLRMTAQLQAAKDAWTDKPPPGLSDALLRNRRLWLLFIDSVSSEENMLPVAVRQSILNIGVFVRAEIFSLMTKPKLSHIENLIRINRKLAAGLKAKAVRQSPQAA
jgi:flagellar biosynthesis activator protein FlaF